MADLLFLVVVALLLSSWGYMRTFERTPSIAKFLARQCLCLSERAPYRLYEPIAKIGVAIPMLARYYMRPGYALRTLRRWCVPRPIRMRRAFAMYFTEGHHAYTPEVQQRVTTTLQSLKYTLALEEESLRLIWELSQMATDLPEYRELHMSYLRKTADRHIAEFHCERAHRVARHFSYVVLPSWRDYLAAPDPSFDAPVMA